MRSCAAFVLACAVLGAGGDSTTDLTPRVVSVGESFPTSVSTASQPEGTFECNLHTPAGDIIQFRPNNRGDPEKYELRPFNPLHGCAVDVKVTSAADEGVWRLSFVPTNPELQSREEVYKIELSTKGGEPTTDPTPRVLSVGESFPTSVSTANQPEGTFECNLQTPAGEVIQFRPNNGGDPEKYELRPFNPLNGCAVDVKVTSSADEGVWRLSFVPTNPELKSREEVYKIEVHTEVPGGEPTTVRAPRVLSVGEYFPTSVNTANQLEGTFECNLQTPVGKTIQFRPNNRGDPEKYELRPFNLLNGCAVDVKVTSAEDEGIWTLSFVPTSTDIAIYEQSYEIEVNMTAPLPSVISDRGATTTSYLETTPLSRNIENLEDVFFNTSIGKTHEVAIRYFDFVTTQSCHIVTPEGDEYDLYDDDSEIDIDGIKVIKHSEVACGVEINVRSESLIGQWMLFSKDERHGTPIERRLNFTIYVEEVVKASPEQIIITEGNDLYLRLASPTSYHSTCNLVAPDDLSTATITKDENYKERCGFIVSNVLVRDSGMWEIVYGQKIIYKAPIHVTVNGALSNDLINLEFEERSAVDQHVGPEDAVYCVLKDPRRNVHFEGFGRCQVTLDNVESRTHSGFWLMNVGVQGSMRMREIRVNVTVVPAPVRRPTVITRVDLDESELLLVCSIEGEQTIRSCVFQSPGGSLYLSTQGVGEDRFTSHLINGRMETSVNSTECGLRISNPHRGSDGGIWRCAVETSAGDAFGFLSVLMPSPWAQQSVLVPEIRFPNSLSAVEGSPVTILCSVNAAIRYCYFTRRRESSMFSVGPGSRNESFEYVGRGFDAGDCGIRFHTMRPEDSDNWTCNVGFPNGSRQEMGGTIHVSIARQITVQTSHAWSGLGWDAYGVSGQVFQRQPLEYCRYIRNSDGQGFSSENLPAGYESTDELDGGLCRLFIRTPSWTDRTSTWTVAAKIVGRDGEVYGTSPESIFQQDNNPQPSPSENVYITQTSSSTMWLLIVMLISSIALFAVMVFPKRNRKWAANKATVLRNSFRKKQPLHKTPPVVVTQHQGVRVV